MNSIRILSETLANKIAAGEVIERPASIVKELVENSLDAGAKTIEVTVNYAGKSLIRVADDGCGMTALDAELCFQRHATSKITSDEDLGQISSYGFRGEALPSIAAVSRVKLITREKGAASGTEVVIEGGKLQSVKESACGEGAVVEVRDLFFNTPARRKFLRGNTTEKGHVYEMLCNLALSRTDVHFIYKEDNKTILDFTPGQTIKERAILIWGQDTAPHLIELKNNLSDVQIYGVIGKPHSARSSRSGQVYFVNRRWVRSFSLSYALQAGYHGLLMHGQFPVGVIFVDVNLARVDVNVHPTKQEVRISNEAEIKSLLKDLVAQALSKHGDLSPSLRSSSRDLPSFLSPSYDSKEAVAPLRVHENTSAPYLKPLIKAEAELIEAISLRNQLKITKILGQIHNTFVVAETEEGLMLIDQHAAHERVMFEILVKSFQEAAPVSQRLLMEEVLELHPKYLEIFQQALPLLQKLGFEIEVFGPQAYVIRAVPAAFEKENAQVVLKSFLEEKEEGKLRTGMENHQEEIAALIACKKKSVRAFDPLNAAQLQALLERLAQCQNPFSCPHGRPAVIKLSFEDLEKQFKRKL